MKEKAALLSDNDSLICHTDYFEKHMEKLGMLVIDTKEAAAPGDPDFIAGNCQFRTLACSIFANDQTAKQVREMVAGIYTRLANTSPNADFRNHPVTHLWLANVGYDLTNIEQFLGEPPNYLRQTKADFNECADLGFTLADKPVKRIHWAHLFTQMARVTLSGLLDDGSNFWPGHTTIALLMNALDIEGMYNCK